MSSYINVNESPLVGWNIPLLSALHVDLYDSLQRPPQLFSYYHDYFYYYLYYDYIGKTKLLYIMLKRTKLFTKVSVKTVHDNIFQFIEYLEYGVTVIFCLEMILRVIDLGFVIHPGSYLRDPWNVLDAVVVLVSILRVAV